MGASQKWTLAMQHQSYRSAFSAATVQAVLYMICVLFLLAWPEVFGKQNYSLTITSYINRTREIPISEYGIVVNVSDGKVNMVNYSTPMKVSPSFGASELVWKYRMYFGCDGATVGPATYCSKLSHISDLSTKAVNLLHNRIFSDLFRVMSLNIPRGAMRTSPHCALRLLGMQLQRGVQ